jgi:predicted  nucleic acid-binding Zn-ribbon protein
MTFNDEVEDLRERNADLAEELAFWRNKAEKAEEGLRFALEGLQRQEPQLAEMRRQLDYAQTLLAHATEAIDA